MTDCSSSSRANAIVFLLGCMLFLAACGPSTPEERLAAAREAIASGEPRAAEIHLRNLLREEPGHAEARLLYGELLLAVGDPAEAERSLRRAMELGVPYSSTELPLLGALVAQGKFAEVLTTIAEGPDLPLEQQVPILLLEGKAHQGLGSFREAEAAYRAAIDLQPGSLVARTEFAGFLLDRGRNTEAGRLIAGVLAAETDFAPALLLRGVMEHSAARYDAAESSFKTALGADSCDRRTRLATLARLVETQLALGKISDAAASADLVLAASPRDPIARYLKARVQFEQNDIDGATRRLQALTAEFPRYGPALTLLGSIHRKEDQPGQAIMYLRAAVNNNPSDQAARLMLAEAYISVGDLDSARNLFDDSSALGGMDGLFLASAGRLSLEGGQPELAADYFDRAADSAPDSVNELIGVSSVYLAAGEFERAIRLLQESSIDTPESDPVRDYLLALVQLRLGDLPAARVAAVRLVDAQPKAAWSLNLLGTIDMLSQDLEGARETYTRALELEPQNVPALLNLARVEAASNDNERAVQLLRQVLEIDSRQITATVGLAQLAAKRGDLDEAHSWLSRGPESALLLQLQGELFTEQTRYREATEAFSRAYELKPSGELALKIYAVATRAGVPDPDQALREWVASNPGDIGGHFVLGMLAQSAEDYDAATKHYESILAVDPAHAAALNNLAGLYALRGDERALGFAARAYELQPGDPAIADTFGWLLVMNDRADVALPLLEQAVAGLPDSLEVRYHRAVAVAEASGDSERSLRELRDLLESGASFPSRADAEAYLARLERRAER